MPSRLLEMLTGSSAEVPNFTCGCHQLSRKHRAPRGRDRSPSFPLPLSASALLQLNSRCRLQRGEDEKRDGNDEKEIQEEEEIYIVTVSHVTGVVWSWTRGVAYGEGGNLVRLKVKTG